MAFDSTLKASLVIKIIRKFVWAGVYTIILEVECISNARGARIRVALIALYLVTGLTFI
jgi:hypothetical protein